jgi:hypothetical protein
MKSLVLALGTAVALVATSGTASADHWKRHGGHGHGYHSQGYYGGHYHFVPAHLHYHPDHFGGHYHYHGPSLQYHRGPDIIPVRSYGYPGYGYGGYRGYRPGVSFGFTFIR